MPTATSRHGCAVACAFVLPLRFAVPVDAIWAVWDAFHSVAEGFGIGEEETCEILTCLQPALALTRGRLARLSRGLFRRLDTDDNGLIDSMELLSCLASISSMGLAQRIDCEPIARHCRIGCRQ